MHNFFLNTLHASFYDVTSYNRASLARLDSVRGLMALAILGCHFCALFGDVFLSVGCFSPFSLAKNASIGLCYFFVLSGFVISYSQQRKQQCPALVKYAAKRYLRLLPPVAISIFAMWAMMRYFYFPLDNVQSEWLLSFPQYNYDSNALPSPVVDVFWNAFFSGFAYYNSFLWAIRFEFLAPLALIIVNPLITRRWVQYVVVVIIVLCCGVLIEKRWFYVGCMILGMLFCQWYAKGRKLSSSVAYNLFGGAI